MLPKLADLSFLQIGADCKGRQVGGIDIRSRNLYQLSLTLKKGNGLTDTEGQEGSVLPCVVEGSGNRC